MYLCAVNDLTIGTLQLLKLANKVPETALRNNLVGGKDAHAQELRVGIHSTRILSANDLVLVKRWRVLSCQEREVEEGTSGSFEVNRHQKRPRTNRRLEQ